MQENLDRNLEYQYKLEKKIDLMNKVSTDAYGIANLTVDAVFEHLTKKEVDPIIIWNAIDKNYGKDFFLVIIESIYGRRFVSEYDALYEEIRNIKKESEESVTKFKEDAEAEVKMLKTIIESRTAELAEFREEFSKTVVKV